MNKKGIDYAGLLVAVTIICAVALYVQVAKQTDPNNGLIGERQTAVLMLNSEVQFYESFVKLAAKQALFSTLSDLKSKLESFPDAIIAERCILLNTNAAPQNLVPIDVLGAVKAIFNKYMNVHNRNYENEMTGWTIPLNNYEIAVEKGKFTGIAVIPTTISFYRNSSTSNIYVKTGTATFRPTFQFNSDHKLEEIPLIFDAMGVIAHDCSNIANPFDCANEKVTNSLPGWAVSKGPNNLVKFIPLPSVDKPCFALVLPEKAQAQTT